MESCELLHHSGSAFSVSLLLSYQPRLNHPRLLFSVVVNIVLLQLNKICLEKQGQSTTWSINLDISEVPSEERILIFTLYSEYSEGFLNKQKWMFRSNAQVVLLGCRVGNDVAGWTHWSGKWETKGCLSWLMGKAQRERQLAFGAKAWRRCWTWYWQVPVWQYSTNWSSGPLSAAEEGRFANEETVRVMMLIYVTVTASDAPPVELQEHFGTLKRELPEKIGFHVDNKQACIQWETTPYWFYSLFFSTSYDPIYPEQLCYWEQHLVCFFSLHKI